MTVTRRRRVQVVAEPCACDERGGVCGWHYQQLDDYQQAQVRKRRGIRFGRGRVAGIVGSRDRA